MPTQRSLLNSNNSARVDHVRRRGRGPSINTILQKNKVNLISTQGSLMTSDFSLVQNVSVIASNERIPPSDNINIYQSPQNVNTHNSAREDQVKRRGRGPSINTILQKNKGFTTAPNQTSKSNFESSASRISTCRYAGKRPITYENSIHLDDHSHRNKTCRLDGPERIHKQGKQPIGNEYSIISYDGARENKSGRLDGPESLHTHGTRGRKSSVISSFVQSIIKESVMWDHERHNKSNKNAPATFSLCCKNGQVELPKEKQPPESLASLLTSNHFRPNIRVYNAMFAMCSSGRRIDHKINKGSIRDQVDQNIVEALMQMFHEHNKVVEQFITAREHFKNDTLDEYRLVLISSEVANGHPNIIGPSNEVYGLQILIELLKTFKSSTRAFQTKITNTFKSWFDSQKG
ncbi:hypothetical protein AgCh_020351 [Apium graveolens]